MCWGGKSSSSSSAGSSLASDPRAFYRWWKPPEIETPTLRLNADALDRKDLEKKKQGTKRFQVPLAPTGALGAGLGIPTTSVKRKEGV